MLLKNYHVGQYEILDEGSAKNVNIRMKCYLDKAAKEGIKSCMAHKHGCVIVYDGIVIAKGHNKWRKDSDKENYSVHAEVDAIRRAGKKYKYLLPRSDLYVVRVACAEFERCFKYSKPCSTCQKFIRKLGIKRVFYSTNAEFECRLQTVRP